MDKLFFWSKFSFGFWCDLSDKDISSFDNGSNSDYSIIIQVFEFDHGDSRNIVRRFFRPEFSICYFYLIFFNLYRSQFIILDESLRDDDSIFVVVSFPWHERYPQIFSECHFSTYGTWSFCDKISFLEFFTKRDPRYLCHT